MANDPLLTPFRLKHLTLRNRIMITSHEPAYPEDGMPKDRYRAYTVERARAGVALTMTAGSASVARDSPPVFNNVPAWKDEVVGWTKRIADECHGHGAAVMIQLTHLGRRTRWDAGDDLYADLKPLSKNLGEIDHEALAGGRPQEICANPAGAFQLFRIGMRWPPATRTQRSWTR